MKQIPISVTIIILILFQACKNKDTVQIDIIGTWVSTDGARLVLNKDSSFIGKALPAEYFTFFTSKKDVEGKRVNGSGVWNIENVEGYKEVKLIFTKMDGKDIFGFYSIYISGEKGALNNKPPWYLFVWKEEEGGERYKFEKHY